MGTARTAACAFVVAAVMSTAAAHGQTPALGSQVSPWVELNNARVRMLAGPPTARGAKAHLAGVEIALGDGWKTYWRMPGDAGVPPNFDWSGSSNVASVSVLYPAPMRMTEPAAETVGYKHAVLFPIEVVAKDPSRPVALALALEFGVCREICIPAEARFSLTLPAASPAGAPSPALLAALERVPRPATARRADDPRVTRASAFLEGGTPHLVIVARFPRGEAGADLFVEAPDGLYVPMAKRLPGTGEGGEARPEADADSGLVRFQIDLSRTGNAAELRGKTLKLTLVSEAGATETAWTVP